MAEHVQETQKKANKKTRTSFDRSPAYPGLPLATALERARTIHEKEGKNAAPIDAVAKHWGYSVGSGKSLVSISALKKFGLIVDEGIGKNRHVRLSQTALRILLDSREESPERDRLLKEVALNPAIHSELWSKYFVNEGKLPSDETLTFHLRADRGFTESGARDFIKEFKDTIEFARLGKSDILSAGVQDKEAENRPDETPADARNPGAPLTEKRPERREYVARRNPMECGAAQNTRQDTYTLLDGRDVLLVWPKELTEDDAGDLETWLNLMIGKIKKVASLRPRAGEVLENAKPEGA